MRRGRKQASVIGNFGPAPQPELPFVLRGKVKVRPGIPQPAMAGNVPPKDPATDDAYVIRPKSKGRRKTNMSWDMNGSDYANIVGTPQFCPALAPYALRNSIFASSKTSLQAPADPDYLPVAARSFYELSRSHEGDTGSTLDIERLLLGTTQQQASEPHHWKSSSMTVLGIAPRSQLPPGKSAKPSAGDRRRLRFVSAPRSRPGAGKVQCPPPDRQARLLCILSEKKEIILRLLRARRERKVPEGTKQIVAKKGRATHGVSMSTASLVGRVVVSPPRARIKQRNIRYEGEGVESDSLFKIRVHIKRKYWRVTY